jgi:hypothetical protein
MASPALTMLSRSPGAREIFVNSGGVGYAVGKYLSIFMFASTYIYLYVKTIFRVLKGQIRKKNDVFYELFIIYYLLFINSFF